jgi:hypothetical protein
MEAELDRIISIFYYLPDKDLFAEIYRSTDFRACASRVELHVVCGLL